MVATLGTLLGGCATTRNLSDEDRKKISVVRIDRNVLKPTPMTFRGPGTDAKALQEFAEKNGIFIEKIAFQEIDAAILESGILKVSDSEEATGAIITIAVHVYGFSIPHGFSSDLVPIVAIGCRMVDSTGKVIWVTSDSVLPLRNPVEPMSLEAMREDPKRIEDAWRKASRQIARNIAKTL